MSRGFGVRSSSRGNEPLANGLGFVWGRGTAEAFGCDRKSRGNAPLGIHRGPIRRRVTGEGIRGQS